MEANEQGNAFNSFTEYRQADPQGARAALAYDSYAALCDLGRDKFWDEQVYRTLKQTLGVENPVMHTGIRLLTLEDQNRHEEAIAGRTPGSIAEYAVIARRQNERYRKELEDWKQVEPEEYEKAKELIDVIEEGKLEQFDQERLKQMLRRSIYCFPGIALSYKIQKNEETVQAYEEELAKKKATANPAQLKEGKSARERYQEYLRQQNSGSVGNSDETSPEEGKKNLK